MLIIRVTVCASIEVDEHIAEYDQDQFVRVNDRVNDRVNHRTGINLTEF